MPVSERLKEQTKTRLKPGAAPAARRFQIIYSPKDGSKPAALTAHLRNRFEPMQQRPRLEGSWVSAPPQAPGKAKKASHRGMYLVARPATFAPSALVDVALVPLVLLHLRKVLVGMVKGAVRPFGNGVEQGKLHILRHPGRIAANVKVSAAF